MTNVEALVQMYVDMYGNENCLSYKQMQAVQPYTIRKAIMPALQYHYSDLSSQEMRNIDKLIATAQVAYVVYNYKATWGKR